MRDWRPRWAVASGPWAERIAPAAWAPRLVPLLGVVQIAFVLVWSALWITIALALLILSWTPKVPLALARRVWAPGMCRLALADVRREPLPDLDWSRPYVFAMNHQSFFDVVIAFATIPQNLRFVAKHSLKYTPFFGWYMWATGMVFVDRSDRKSAISSLAEAGRHIRAGASILVYPEGTRSRDRRIQPFKKGPFVVALEAGVPIVPIAVEGTAGIMPPGAVTLRPGSVRVKVGEPIPTAGLAEADRDALMHRVREAMIALHRDVGGPGGSPD
jgi:1-acyl-sn-glycerol-3-phosphate acyltransferase